MASLGGVHEWGLGYLSIRFIHFGLLQYVCIFHGEAAWTLLTSMMIRNFTHHFNAAGECDALGIEWLKLAPILWLKKNKGHGYVILKLRAKLSAQHRPLNVNLSVKWFEQKK